MLAATCEKIQRLTYMIIEHDRRRRLLFGLYPLNSQLHEFRREFSITLEYFAGNFLSPVNNSRRIHAAKISANSSDEFFTDIPWLRYIANLHEYWIERLSSFTNFLAA